MKTCLISVILAIVPTLTNAAGGCGIGCHSTAGGACVVDGWETGSFVWNECPDDNQSYGGDPMKRILITGAALTLMSSSIIPP